MVEPYNRVICTVFKELKETKLTKKQQNLIQEAWDMAKNMEWGLLYRQDFLREQYLEKEYKEYKKQRIDMRKRGIYEN